MKFFCIVFATIFSWKPLYSDVSIENFIYNGPDIDEVSIKDLWFRGKGCTKDNTKLLKVSSTGSSTVDYFQITYDDFSVEKGKEIPSPRRQNFCKIFFNLTYPQGWSYSFSNVHYEGFAEIGKKSSGRFQTSYEFPFVENKKTKTKVQLEGPFEGRFSQEDSNSIFKKIWSPCDLSSGLEIRSTLILKGPSKEYSQMTMDIQSGYLKQRLTLQWKRCENIIQIRSQHEN